MSRKSGHAKDTQAQCKPIVNVNNIIGIKLCVNMYVYVCE